MIKEGPIVCIGVMVADLIGGPVDRIPDPGSLSLVDNMGLYPGGGAINTAAALSRLGLEVELIGKVGVDPLGNFLVDNLESSGVGTAYVQRDRKISTSASMVIVDPDGERRFIHYLGANSDLTLDDISFEIVSGASIVLVTGAMVMPGFIGCPLEELFKEASRSGAITCLDTAWDESGQWLETLAASLPHVDYFLPSLGEAQAMTGQQSAADAAQVLLDLGVRTVAVKMAGEGCLVVTNTGEEFHIPAYEVDIVDATGAGDSFDAGFIAGLRMGRSLASSALLANAVGALCVTEYGAAGGVRSLPEAERFMAETPQRIPALGLMTEPI
jgi:sugar/nucleoside kinase (ribokinase family)